MVEMKKCIGFCGLEKKLNKDNFYWRKDLNNWKCECKSCVKNRNKSNYENNKEIILEKQKIYNEPRKEFLKEYRHKYYENNKETIAANQKQYYEDNKEKALANVKAYREANKEKINEHIRKYAQKNKHILNEKKKIYLKEKRNTNESFKLRAYFSRSIRLALTSNKSSKNGHSIMEYLPYTIDELKAHLESLFEPWMNWSNWGQYILSEWDDNNQSTWKWQIDHVIPQCDLLFTSMEDDNFQKCWALDNLRPLNAKQNILDGAKKTKNKKVA